MDRDGRQGLPCPAPLHLPGKVASPLLQAPTCLGPGQRAVLRQGLALDWPSAGDTSQRWVVCFWTWSSAPAFYTPEARSNPPGKQLKCLPTLPSVPWGWRMGAETPRARAKGEAGTQMELIKAETQLLLPSLQLGVGNRCQAQAFSASPAQVQMARGGGKDGQWRPGGLGSALCPQANPPPPGGAVAVATSGEMRNPGPEPGEMVVASGAPGQVLGEAEGGLQKETSFSWGAPSPGDTGPSTSGPPGPGRKVDTTSGASLQG